MNSCSICNFLWLYVSTRAEQCTGTVIILRFIGSILCSFINKVAIMPAKAQINSNSSESVTVMH